MTGRQADPPILYHISDDRPEGPCPRTCFPALARLGVRMFQLRKKQMDSSSLAALGAEVAKDVRGEGTSLLMNGDVEAALQSGFHGVHLPAFSTRVAGARAAAPRGFRVGMSVHDWDELSHAESQEVDFVAVGPVFPARCKIDRRGPLGLATLRAMVARTRLPVLALGGVSADNAGDILACGVSGLAGISFFHHAGELERIMKRIGG